MKSIICINSTTLPTDQRKIDIDETQDVKSLKRFLRDEFDLPNLKFMVFLRSDKKWYILDEKLSLGDYPMNGKNLQLDLKREVDISKIKELVQKDLKRQEEDYPYGVLHVETTSADKTRRMIVDISQRFLNDALRDPSNVSFSIPSRAGDNIGFDEDTELVLLGKQRIARQFRNLSSVKSVQQLTGLMKLLHEVLLRDIHSTKRDIFYMDVNSFETQNASDNLIEDVGAMLQVTRPSMNITASSKGVVIGHIEFTERGDPIDCRRIGSGKSITPNIDDIDNLQSDAEFVLVIEKDAVFNRLAEDQFYDYIPSILVTAKGQPDMATRMFLKKINDELNLPILAIMDADIYGFEILRVYSVGSKALSFEASNLAVPNIKWLGLLPSDLTEDSGFSIPKSTHLKMTKSDERRIKLLLEEEFVIRKPQWGRQIQTLLDLGIKAEIQALNARDPQFITNHYLPSKLETGDLI